MKALGTMTELTLALSLGLSAPNAGCLSNVEKTMIIELTTRDFEALLKGIAPRHLRLVQDSAIAPPEILEMLNRLATEISAEFSPSAWMIVEDGEIVGLCSIVRVPQEGNIHIGYGVAPSRQGLGCTARAIGQLLEWARNDPRVALISAETGLRTLRHSVSLNAMDLFALTSVSMPKTVR